MQVRIYKPTKSAMQSGGGKDLWLLENIKTPGSKFKEELMLRTSSFDMYNQIKISFPKPEDAIRFAERKGYIYEVISPKIPSIPKKTYAANFQ